MSENFGSFLDQSPVLSAQPAGLLASTDNSEPYEVEEHGIFKLLNSKFAYIAISGCSCWPDRGGTEVTEADTLEELRAKVQGEQGEWSYGLGTESWNRLVDEAIAAPETPTV